MKLNERSCISCESDLTSLSIDEIDKLLLELNDKWELVDDYLQRKFKFSNFNEGLDFINQIGSLCEKENHHPVIQLSWGKVIVMLRTVKIDSLSINDFILAAKIDDIK